MQLFFDPAFDGGAWPGALQGREAVAGEAWVGSLGLLQVLETRLGLTGPCFPSARRGAALVPALRGQDGFWSRSATLDPLGTAFELLRWRDRLWQSGWRGQALSPRLSELARVTAAVLPGVPDRLAQVSAALKRRSADIGAVTVFGASAPAVWRSIFAALAIRKTRVSYQPIEAAAASGDLECSRSPGFCPQGDGSLLLLRPHGPLQAAEEVAAWLASEPGLPGTVIIGGEPLLDAALQRFGLPTTGAAGGEQENLLLEALPLALELCWEPAHPQRALELLLLPDGPVPPSLARRLARALGVWPSIESDEWKQALAEGLQAIAEKERRARVTARLAALFQRRVRGSLCPVALAEERARALADWAASRAAVEEREGGADAPAFVAAREQCHLFLELLEVTDLAALTRDQLRTLVELATAEAPAAPGVVFEPQAGVVAVGNPGALVGPVERVLWWSFRRDTAPPLSIVPLTAAERASLAGAGVSLPDPGLEAVRQAESWRRPLLCAKKALVLVCPLTGADGGDVFPHPLWDEITACLAADAVRSRIERLAPPFFPIARRQRRKRLAQPLAPACWRVSPKQISRREAESANSLGTLIGCPLRWVLEYSGKLEDGLAVDTTASNLNLGRLAHHVIERFLLRQGPSAGRAEEEAGDLFDELAPRLVAALYLEGADGLRSHTRQAIARAAADLVALLRATGRTVASSEEQHQSKTAAGMLRGFPDLVLAPVPAVIDLKWSGAGHHGDALANGTAYQLAVYSQLVGARSGASSRNCFPPVAYFIIESQRCLTTDVAAFGEVEVLEGPAPRETWEGLVKACARRRAELQKGRLLLPERTEDGEALPDQLVDGHLVLGSPCTFCSYGVICGQSTGG